MTIGSGISIAKWCSHKAVSQGRSTELRVREDARGCMRGLVKVNKNVSECVGGTIQVREGLWGANVSQGVCGGGVWVPGQRCWQSFLLAFPLTFWLHMVIRVLQPVISANWLPSTKLMIKWSWDAGMGRSPKTNRSYHLFSTIITLNCHWTRGHRSRTTVVSFILSCVSLQEEHFAITSEFENYKVRVHNVLKQKNKSSQSETDVTKQER